MGVTAHSQLRDGHLGNGDAILWRQSGNHTSSSAESASEVAAGRSSHKNKNSCNSVQLKEPPSLPTHIPQV